MGAVFSPDRKYRYRLSRQVETAAHARPFWGFADPHLHGTVCWVMLNPSTADEDVNDPTITRCIRFTRMWGYAHLVVVNLFALRSKDPSVLYEYTESRGGLGSDLVNLEHVVDAVRHSEISVCAWGAHGVLCNNVGMTTIGYLKKFNRPIMYLDKTITGQPAHPLYLPKHLTPKMWGFTPDLGDLQ